MAFWNRKPAKKFPFSSGESFRLATEGLRALSQYAATKADSDLSEAEDKFSQAARKYPGDFINKVYLGAIKLARGDAASVESGIELLNDVVEYGPEDLKFSARINLAAAHFVQGDKIVARTLMETLLKENPDKIQKAELHYNLGKVEEADGHLDQARRHFEKAAKNLPAAREALKNVGSSPKPGPDILKPPF